RTGHAMLHTLYQQSLRNKAEFFIEYFALDLTMEDGECLGVVAWNLDDGTSHRFRAPRTSLATGGSGRACVSCACAHTRTHAAGGRRTAGARRGCGSRTNSGGQRFMERHAREAKDLPTRDGGSRALAIEINGGRGVGPQKAHI